MFYVRPIKSKLPKCKLDSTLQTTNHLLSLSRTCQLASFLPLLRALFPPPAHTLNQEPHSRWHRYLMPCTDYSDHHTTIAARDQQVFLPVSSNDARENPAPVPRAGINSSIFCWSLETIWAMHAMCCNIVSVIWEAVHSVFSNRQKKIPAQHAVWLSFMHHYIQISKACSNGNQVGVLRSAFL